MKRLKGQCYDCGSVIRCDEGGLASYHATFGSNRECPGSREAVIPSSIVDADKPEGVVRMRSTRLEYFEPKPKAPPKPRLELVPPPPAEPPTPPAPPEQPVLQLEPEPEIAPTESPDMEQVIEEDEIMPVHAAFQGSRGHAPDYDARKTVVLDTIRAWFSQTKKWPSRVQLMYKLGIRGDALLKVLQLLTEDDMIRINRDGGIEVISGAAKTKPMPKPTALPKKPPKAPPPPESEEVVVDDEDEDDEEDEDDVEEDIEDLKDATRKNIKELGKAVLNVSLDDEHLKEDPLYKQLCSERDTLEEEVRELEETLKPKADRLRRIQQAVRAYVSYR